MRWSIVILFLIGVLCMAEVQAIQASDYFRNLTSLKDGEVIFTVSVPTEMPILTDFTVLQGVMPEMTYQYLGQCERNDPYPIWDKYPNKTMYISGYMDNITYFPCWKHTDSFLSGTYPYRGRAAYRMTPRTDGGFGLEMDWIPAVNISGVKLAMKEWAWWNVSFARKRNVTFLPSNETLTDFPALVRINETQYMQNGAADIRFTNESCDLNGTIIPWEIERYAENNTEVWVKVNISTSSKVICMYYNCSSCVDASQPSNVWRSEFYMVLHMNETSGNHQDSTATNNDAVPTFDGTGYQGGSAYKISGGGDYYDAENDDLNTGNDIDHAGSVTYETWYNMTAAPAAAGIDSLISKGYAGTTTPHNLWVTNAWDGDTGFTFSRGDSVDIFESSVGALPTLGLWYHAVGVWDSSISRTKIYQNGILYDSDAATRASGNNNVLVHIGAADWSGHNFFANGVMDEVRIWDGQQTSGWINYTYQNMYNQASMVIFGPAETQTAPAVAPFITEPCGNHNALHTANYSCQANATTGDTPMQWGINDSRVSIITLADTSTAYISDNATVTDYNLPLCWNVSYWVNNSAGNVSSSFIYCVNDTAPVMSSAWWHQNNTYRNGTMDAFCLATDAEGDILNYTFSILKNGNNVSHGKARTMIEPTHAVPGMGTGIQYHLLYNYTPGIPVNVTQMYRSNHTPCDIEVQSWTNPLGNSYYKSFSGLRNDTKCYINRLEELYFMGETDESTVLFDDWKFNMDGGGLVTRPIGIFYQYNTSGIRTNVRIKSENIGFSILSNSYYDLVVNSTQHTGPVKNDNYTIYCCANDAALSGACMEGASLIIANTPPVFSQDFADQTIQNNHLLNMSGNVTDIDGDEMNLTSNCSLNTTINNATGAITWSYIEYHNKTTCCRLNVTDISGGSDTDDFCITTQPGPLDNLAIDAFACDVADTQSVVMLVGLALFVLALAAFFMYLAIPVISIFGGLGIALFSIYVIQCNYFLAALYVIVGVAVMSATFIRR